jgi:hypothetical protein
MSKNVKNDFVLGGFEIFRPIVKEGEKERKQKEM